MNSAHSFIDLKARLEQGDKTAGDEIFRRYGQQLIRVVSPRISSSLKQKIDPEDLVQSAFRSFFRVGPVDAFQTESWNDLWAILVTITLRKCRHQVRHFLASKRNMNREQSTSTESSWADWQFVATEPTPAEAVELTDLITHFLQSLDERLRRIAELSMLGKTPGEIGAELNLTERTVYRQLERLHDKLKALEGPAEDGGPSL